MSNIQILTNLIKSGGVALIPTDTVFGLICSAVNDNAIDNITQIKQRQAHKPYSILLPCYDDIQKFAHINAFQQQFIKDNLCGKLTFIVQCKESTQLSRKIMSFNSQKNINTIGFRVPDNQLCVELIQRLGAPLVATSANLSGHATPKDFNSIAKEIMNSVDHFIAGECGNIPSAIVDISNSHAMSDVGVIRGVFS